VNGLLGSKKKFENGNTTCNPACPAGNLQPATCNLQPVTPETI
jgi:hypothetical protein